MKLHEVQPSTARKSKIRRGRGDASGYGSFSGRGCKGQNARSGGGVRAGFEGGQSTIIQRMPKLRGFKNLFRTEYTGVNLIRIDEKFSEGETVSDLTLLEKRVISSTKNPIKILGNGNITKKLHFEGVFFTAPAKEKAEKAGCTFAE